MTSPVLKHISTMPTIRQAHYLTYLCSHPPNYQHAFTALQHHTLTKIVQTSLLAFLFSTKLVLNVRKAYTTWRASRPLREQTCYRCSLIQNSCTQYRTILKIYNRLIPNLTHTKLNPLYHSWFSQMQFRTKACPSTKASAHSLMLAMHATYFATLYHHCGTIPTN